MIMRAAPFLFTVKGQISVESNGASLIPHVVHEDSMKKVASVPACVMNTQA
jgi:hypothetical protein